MGVNTQKYIRKPLYVDAVRVTSSNFDDIVAWCQGEVQVDEIPGSGVTKKFIKVRVHNPKNPRQTKAFIGDWLLYTERGYKVYTNKAFRGAFDPVEEPVGEYDPEAEAEESSAAPISGVPPTPPDEEEPTVIEDAEIKSMGPVAEEPSPETGVQPIHSVGAAVDEHTTPQGEPHEYVEATPEAIAEVVNEQQPVEPEETAVDKRVLTEEEQQQMGAEEVQDLVRSGEAILAQDLA